MNKCTCQVVWCILYAKGLVTRFTALRLSSISYAQTGFFTFIKHAAGELLMGDSWQILRGDDIGGQQRTVMAIWKDVVAAKGLSAFACYRKKIKSITGCQGTVSANLG